MKIIFLTHSEAADARVIAHVRALLDETVETQATGSGLSLDEHQALRSIGIDAPDVGTPPASEVFGASPLPQGLPGALSIAGAGLSSTAPEALPGTLQSPVGFQTGAALPASLAPAPTGHAAPTHMSPAGVELDADGLPWDQRIHAGSKGKNKGDGRWTARRGLNDPALIARVQAELRQALAAPAGGAVAAPLPLPSALAPAAGGVLGVPDPTAAFAAPAALPGSLPGLTPAPLLAPAGGAPVVSHSEAFAKLVARVSPYTATGQLTPDRLNEVAQSVGVPTFPMLAARPDLHAQFALNLGLPAEVQS